MIIKKEVRKKDWYIAKGKRRPYLKSYYPIFIELKTE